MAFSASDLDTINAAIVRGELEVQFADRRVRYQTTGDMLKAREAIVAELMRVSTTTRPKQAYAVGCKGL
jgi:hypothetical protein